MLRQEMHKVKILKPGDYYHWTGLSDGQLNNWLQVTVILDNGKKISFNPDEIKLL